MKQWKHTRFYYNDEGRVIADKNNETYMKYWEKKDQLLKELGDDKVKNMSIEQIKTKNKIMALFILTDIDFHNWLDERGMLENQNMLNIMKDRMHKYKTKTGQYSRGRYNDIE
jgi:hypothetical protein